MAERIYIFDTTLRDGEQSPGCSMTVPEKLKMAAKLVDLGVDILEAGFPIASDGDFEAVGAVAREFPWVNVAALARSNKLDVERAAQSLKHAKRPRIHTFIATSDIHLKYKLKKSRQQVLDEAVAAVTLARSYVEDVEFSAEDATRTDWDYLEEISKAVVAAGARTVNLPDTVGFSVPDEYGALIARMSKALGNTAVVSVHCHDDLGLAVANSLAAIQNGARQVECTINGIGERAGNAALEEIASALYVRGDRYGVDTSIKLDQLYPTSQVLGQIITFKPSPNKAIVGANAFAHESGIHQHGMLANPLCYEIMTPALVGVSKTHLVLGKHSGRAALRHRLEQLGFTLTRDELQHTYYRFVALADRKKNIYDQDLIGILPDPIRDRRQEPVAELD
jgi:2-isopropylmalate synthase